MGFLFGGGQSRQSSPAGGFRSFDRHNKKTLDQSLRKARFSSEKREKIMGVVGGKFEGGKKISNHRILEEVGALGYDVKKDVRNALTVKNDNSLRRERIKEAALNRYKAQRIKETMQIEGVSNAKILGSIMGKSANQALNDARKGKKGSSDDLTGVGSGRSSSVSILSSGKTGGFAGNPKR